MIFDERESKKVVNFDSYVKLCNVFYVCIHRDLIIVDQWIEPYSPWQ
jgi:hypothetical protein